MGVLRVARPTLFREEYCQMLIDHMSKGLSFESFAAVINVNRDTLYDWRARHDIFLDAQKIGREKQLLNDEIILNKVIRGEQKNSSPAVLIFKMKNCHQWKDQQDVNVNGGEPFKIEIVKDENKTTS
jgi:hypothetical protein